MVGASLHFCLALLLLYLRRASDRGAKRRTDTARVLKTGCVACWRARVLGWVFIFERRLAAVPVQHTGSSRKRQTPRGQRRSPARARTPRGAAILSAFCVRRAPDDGQAAHGWPGQQQPIRPLAASLPSSCRISSRRRAAGTLSSRGSHQPGALGIPRQCVRAARGSCRAANADGPAGRDGRIANERARGRAAWPLAQVARRALSDGCIGTCAHLLTLSARLARGRPVGAASAAVRLSDAPAWTRR
jgi:hypothetical protein